MPFVMTPAAIVVQLVREVTRTELSALNKEHVMPMGTGGMLKGPEF